MDVRLREARAEDEAFLFAVYASTREAELAAVGWAQPQVQAFLRQQFDAQRRAYRQMFPGSDYRIVVWDGQDVGRIFLHQGSDEVRVVDMALLPEHRRGGIGTQLVREAQRQAEVAGLPLGLCVQVGSAAQRLYARLGFRVTWRQPMDVGMEWRPRSLAEGA